MEVSSGTSTAQSNVQVDVMKKSMDVQAQQVLKTLESANEQVDEQSRQTTAQKTGLGNGLNITA